jgi:hypothetical protein
MCWRYAGVFWRAEMYKRFHALALALAASGALGERDAERSSRHGV